MSKKMKEREKKREKPIQFDPIESNRKKTEVLFD